MVAYIYYTYAAQHFLKISSVHKKKQETIFMNGIFPGGLLQSRQVIKGILGGIIRFFRSVKITLPLVLDQPYFLISLSVGRQ
jgi:hypothetical protein